MLVAATRADPDAPSEALTHHVRWPSHQRATRALRAGSEVAATTSQASVEVGLLDLPLDELDVAVGGHPPGVVGGVGVDDDDAGAVLDAPPDPADPDRARPHDDDAASAEVEADERAHPSPR